MRWRRVSVTSMSMSRQVQARCPILMTRDDADMVILPDGEEYWVAR